MFHVKQKEKKLKLNEFKTELLRIFALNESLPTPSDAQVEKLFELTERMLEVNKNMNLTAITEHSAIILKHYADSLTVSKFIPQNSSVIDIGCGAGFPTLPLAIFREDLRIIAVDSTAKRIDYVNETARMLGLDNATAIAARAEELGKSADYREKFDVATARAVANLSVLSELCLPFVKVGGAFVSMKGSQGESEAATAQSAIKLCGGEVKTVNKLSLISNTAEQEPRVIVEIKKISPTPAKYPRHYSQISKKPL